MLNNIPTVVKNLLIINVLFFLAAMAMPDLNETLSGHYYLSPGFRPWQIVTHMFMHANFMHIFLNMYALFVFGAYLEQYWGPRRFLTYYLVTGLGAFFLHELVNHIEVRQMMAALPAHLVEEVLRDGYDVLLSGKNYSDDTLGSLNLAINVPVVGASGAVFGVLLAFGMMFPETRLMLLFPPIPIKAKWFVLGYGAIELLMALQNSPGDSVAHYAHLGGMLFGYVLLKYWQRTANL